MGGARARRRSHVGSSLSIVRVTWLAKYRKVLAETGNEGEAIFEADRSVRRAHGSSARTDDGAMLHETPRSGMPSAPLAFLVLTLVRANIVNRVASTYQELAL